MLLKGEQYGLLFEQKDFKQGGLEDNTRTRHTTEQTQILYLAV